MNPTITKVASLLAGVAVIAIAAFATSLPAEARAGLLLLGGFLCGYPLAPPGSGKAPAALALLLALSAAPELVSCTPNATPEARGAEAAGYVRLGYSAAVVTVKELGDLHHALQQAVRTEEQAKASAVPLRKMLDALDGATAALAKAKPYVEQSDDVEAFRYVREAVAYIDLAVPLLSALGTAPPKEVTEALGYLRGFLRGDK